MKNLQKNIELYFMDGTEINISTNGAEKWLENADYRGVLPHIYAKRGNIYYELNLMTTACAANDTENGNAIAQSGLIVLKKIDFESINTLKKHLATDIASADFFQRSKGVKEIPKYS
jgi:hypothetical protein